MRVSLSLAALLLAAASAPARADDFQSLEGPGLSQGDSTTPSKGAASAKAAGSGGDGSESAGGGSGEAGGGDFQEVNIGETPILGDFGYTSGAGRPVLLLKGGPKWAVKLRHHDAGGSLSNFPIEMGGTNGDFTGNGRYAYRAAIATRKGVLSGPDAVCVGQMHNGDYATCDGACNMSFEPVFGKRGSPSARGGCMLENEKIYYLNIEPVGDGCTGEPALGNGCPLVFEIGNGGQILLNPGGGDAACAHMGRRYDPSIGCVQ
jgi:hypothetical protein